MNGLFFLQADKINNAAYKLTDYGPLGIYAFITMAGFVFMLLFVKRKYERHLSEKDQIIMKLEEKLEKCERRIQHLEDHAMKRLNDSMDHMNDVISENSKSLYENASVVHETKGVLLSIQIELNKRT